MFERWKLGKAPTATAGAAVDQRARCEAIGRETNQAIQEAVALSAPETKKRQF